MPHNQLELEELKDLENASQLQQPKQYRVLLLNDDFTPMDFVVQVLEYFFLMPRQQAIQIMLKVHNEGVGNCGVFTREVAETKVAQVEQYSQQNQHPLCCVMEEE